MADAAQTPIALTIAGSDSSGGAGIQADLKTFTVLGVYGASVLTALTAQNTRGVTAILPVPPEFVRQQIDAVATDLKIAAVKTGMLNDRATVLAVVEGVRRHTLAPLVVDPVMVATSGDMLLQADAVAAVRGDLLPLADILTPNLPEAARLLDLPVAADETEMQAAGAGAAWRWGPRRCCSKAGTARGATPSIFWSPAVSRRCVWRCRASTRPILTARAAPCRPPSPPAWRAASRWWTRSLSAKRFVHAALAGGP